MYFPYYIPYQYIVPQFPIYFNQIPSQTAQIKPYQQSNSNKVQIIKEGQDVILPGKNRFINLSIEDLKQAGYQIKKKVWTQEEDKRLKQLVKIYGTQWDVIEKFMPQRNGKMCYSRFKRIQYSPKKLWKKCQNQKLQQLAQQYKCDWKAIASHFKHRSSKQIKQHYENYLRPQITMAQWSLNEDIKLVNLLNKYGTQWKKIQEGMPERGQNQLKNRYFGRFKRILEKKQQAKRTQLEKLNSQ